MRSPRAVVGAALAALSLVVAPAADRVAVAGGIGARRVVACRPANPECWPAGFDIAPGGRFFYGERYTGQIRVFNPRTGRDRLWRRIPDVATSGEQGLLGLALDPRWPDEPWLYVYHTEGSPLRNRVVRMRRRADGTFRVQTLLTIPAATFHNGGAIGFGPDGMLYVVTGDAGSPARSQDLASRAGKVLRLRPNGGIPADNPFGTRVFSYGHRNSFGFAFDHRTGRLWQSENGPECDDEMNRIRAGRNYGWGPASACPGTSESGPDPVRPVRSWTPPIAPTGVAFCSGCGLGSASAGQLFMGAWNDHRIRRLSLTGDRRGIAAVRIVHTHGSGILGLRMGPRRLHFSTARGIYSLVRP